MDEAKRAWIAIAQDEDGAHHVYHFADGSANREQAMNGFRLICESEGWEPFVKIDCWLIETQPVNFAFRKLTVI